MTHSVQLVAKVVCAQKEENLVNWAAFFYNIENKQDLSNLFANFVRKIYLRDISDIPIAIANTSYLHGVGKIKVLKKCVNSKEKMNLLQDVGVSSTINEKNVGKVSKFILTMFYSGLEDESVT